MQCAYAVLYCYLACLVLPYFSTLFHKRYDFRKKKLIDIKFVLDFSTTFSETFVVLKRIRRDSVMNVRRSSCKVPLVFVRVKFNLNFLARFPKKKTQISNFMKIPPVGTELVHPDRRTETDMTTLIVAFRSFATTPMFRLYVASLLACSLF